MNKRTIRVLVVDHEGADYHRIEQALTQYGIVPYAVDRAVSLQDGVDSLAAWRYDCCFVSAATTSGDTAPPVAGVRNASRRPVVFIVDGQSEFAAPEALAPFEVGRIVRDDMTVPNLLLAIRQALRANAAPRIGLGLSSRISGFPAGALQPAFPV